MQKTYKCENCNTDCYEDDLTDYFGIYLLCNKCCDDPPCIMPDENCCCNQCCDDAREREKERQWIYDNLM